MNSRRCQQQHQRRVPRRDTEHKRSMSGSDDPVVIPESPPPPRRSARSARARSAPKTPKDASSDDDIVALDAPPITPAQPSQSTSTRRPRKKRVSDDEVVFVRESPKPGSSLRGSPPPRVPLKDRFTYAGASAPRARVKRAVNTGPSRPRRSPSSDPAVPSVNTVLLAPRNEPDVPVPSWLGRTSVLLRLRDCPVCRRLLRKGDAGPARWVSSLTSGWS